MTGCAVTFWGVYLIAAGRENTERGGRRFSLQHETRPRANSLTNSIANIQGFRSSVLVDPFIAARTLAMEAEAPIRYQDIPAEHHASPLRNSTARSGPTMPV